MLRSYQLDTLDFAINGIKEGLITVAMYNQVEHLLSLLVYLLVCRRRSKSIEIRFALQNPITREFQEISIRKHMTSRLLQTPYKFQKVATLPRAITAGKPL